MAYAPLRISPVAGAPGWQIQEHRMPSGRTLITLHDDQGNELGYRITDDKHDIWRLSDELVDASPGRMMDTQPTHPGCLGCPHYPHVDRIVLGELTLDLTRYSATWRGDRLDGLTGTEFRLIQAMIRQPGEWLSYRALYDIVKSPGFVSGEGENGWHGAVRSAIKRIRNKFRICDPRFGALQNRNGVGYRWEAP